MATTARESGPFVPRPAIHEGGQARPGESPTTSGRRTPGPARRRPSAARRRSAPGPWPPRSRTRAAGSDRRAVRHCTTRGASACLIGITSAAARARIFGLASTSRVHSISRLRIWLPLTASPNIGRAEMARSRMLASGCFRSPSQPDRLRPSTPRAGRGVLDRREGEHGRLVLASPARPRLAGPTGGRAGNCPSARPPP